MLNFRWSVNWSHVNVKTVFQSLFSDISRNDPCEKPPEESSNLSAIFGGAVFITRFTDTLRFCSVLGVIMETQLMSVSVFNTNQVLGVFSLVRCRKHVLLFCHLAESPDEGMRSKRVFLPCSSALNSRCFQSIFWCTGSRLCCFAVVVVVLCYFLHLCVQLLVQHKKV